METHLIRNDSKGLILLVDDEATIIDVCTLMLQRLGYEVLEARNGRTAVEMFEKNNRIVDLVILDMQMPGMNGAAVYDRLKKIKSDVKVLLASGYFENQHIRDMLTAGHDDLIKKPFNVKQLSDKLKEIMS